MIVEAKNFEEFGRRMDKSYAELYKEACNLEKNLETHKQTHNTGDIEILTTETGKLTVPLNKTKDTCFNCGAAGHYCNFLIFIQHLFYFGCSNSTIVTM